MYSCCSLVTMALRLGPQVLWQLIVPGGFTTAGAHGFQGIQTVTLVCFSSLISYFPNEHFLMTIACDERVMLELCAQAVWQFPTFSRKEVQLFVHMSRSFSDQLLRVDRLTNFSLWIVPRSSSISSTSQPSFIRMLAPNWCMILIGVNGGMNCCLPSVDMGSSSMRNRITPFTPTIPARKSRTCTTLAVPTTRRDHVGRCHIHGH